MGNNRKRVFLIGGAFLLAVIAIVIVVWWIISTDIITITETNAGKYYNRVKEALDAKEIAYEYLYVRKEEKLISGEITLFISLRSDVMYDSEDKYALDVIQDRVAEIICLSDLTYDNYRVDIDSQSLSGTKSGLRNSTSEYYYRCDNELVEKYLHTEDNGAFECSYMVYPTVCTRK